MTEHDETKWTGKEAIERLTGRLHGAVTRADLSASELAVFMPLIRLVELTLTDINRIADAVEKLSNFELTKIGEVIFGGVSQAMPNSLDYPVNMALTQKEADTVEALRLKKVVVIPNMD